MKTNRIGKESNERTRPTRPISWATVSGFMRFPPFEERGCDGAAQ